MRVRCEDGDNSVTTVGILRRVVKRQSSQEVLECRNRVCAPTAHVDLQSPGSLAPGGPQPDEVPAVGEKRVSVEFNYRQETCTERGATKLWDPLA